MKRACWFVLGGLIGLFVSALFFCAALLSLLRATPGEWSHPLRLGRWQMDIGVPSALRMATHPLVLRALSGRVLHTPLGPVAWQAGAQPDAWHIVCAPCRLPLKELGREPLVLSRIELDARRVAQNAWRGEFALGDASHAVRGRFQASFDTYGAELRATLPDTPVADAYRLFANAIPEVARAQIEGHLRLHARLRLPQRDLTLQPQIEGFAVAGLGTEALLNAVPGCDAAPRGYGTWLPRAVVAAEDQRFYEHRGYDLQEMSAAWSSSRRQDDAVRGASTLSQQVAKMIYTGDERHPLRKLRELLYAVELDRTLGKARVLNLYLSIAPWGEGRCGAAAAARHYLHKRVDKLTPMGAAWLASLLHNPDREWDEFARSGQVNVKRVGWVIAQLRPMPAPQREALVDALPAWSPPRR